MDNINLVFLFSILSSYFYAGVIGFGYFWHISDTHVDQNYSRSGNADRLCHRDDASHPDTGLFGNFLCDSPEFLVNYTIRAMSILHPKPDFIIWTGDNLPHTKVDPTWNVTYEAIRNTTLSLATSFPGIPIVPCIGNHDSVPTDHLSPEGAAVYRGYLREGAWDSLLPIEAQRTFSKGGYFSYVLRPGLRIVSLNTILWYQPNSYTADVEDPADQFAWLERVLANSSRASEQVYIIGHVPPGFYNRVKWTGARIPPTYHEAHLYRYVDILNKHDVIGQFYGHLHMDLFQVFKYGKGGAYRGSSLLGSSVSPWHSVHMEGNLSLPVNPSVRLVKFSDDSHRLLDYEQYYLNLTEANAASAQQRENETLYKLLYRFTEAYSVSDLSTESLVKVLKNLEENTNGTFDTFFRYLTAGKESVDCNTWCREDQLCAMSSSTPAEYVSCFPPPRQDNTHLAMAAVGAVFFLMWFILCFGCCIYYSMKRKATYQYVQISTTF